MAAFYRVVLAFNSVPGCDVFVALPEANVAKRKPQEEASNREEMLWWDKDRVHDEEVHQELNP